MELTRQASIERLSSLKDKHEYEFPTTNMGKPSKFNNPAGYNQIHLKFDLTKKKPSPPLTNKGILLLKQNSSEKFSEAPPPVDQQIPEEIKVQPLDIIPAPAVEDLAVKKRKNDSVDTFQSFTDTKFTNKKEKKSSIVRRRQVLPTFKIKEVKERQGFTREFTTSQQTFEKGKISAKNGHFLSLKELFPADEDLKGNSIEYQIITDQNLCYNTITNGLRSIEEKIQFLNQSIAVRKSKQNDELELLKRKDQLSRYLGLINEALSVRNEYENAKENFAKERQTQLNVGTDESTDSETEQEKKIESYRFDDEFKRYKDRAEKRQLSPSQKLQIYNANPNQVIGTEISKNAELATKLTTEFKRWQLRSSQVSIPTHAAAISKKKVVQIDDILESMISEMKKMVSKLSNAAKSPDFEIIDNNELKNYTDTSSQNSESSESAFVTYSPNSKENHNNSPPDFYSQHLRRRLKLKSAEKLREEELNNEIGRRRSKSLNVRDHPLIPAPEEAQQDENEVYSESNILLPIDDEQVIQDFESSTNNNIPKVPSDDPSANVMMNNADSDKTVAKRVASVQFRFEDMGDDQNDEDEETGEGDEEETGEEESEDQEEEDQEEYQEDEEANNMDIEFSENPLLSVEKAKEDRQAAYSVCSYSEAPASEDRDSYTPNSMSPASFYANKKLLDHSGAGIHQNLNISTNSKLQNGARVKKGDDAFSGFLTQRYDEEEDEEDEDEDVLIGDSVENTPIMTPVSFHRPVPVVASSPVNSVLVSTKLHNNLPYFGDQNGEAGNMKQQQQFMLITGLKEQIEHYESDLYNDHPNNNQNSNFLDATFTTTAPTTTGNKLLPHTPLTTRIGKNVENIGSFFVENGNLLEEDQKNQKRKLVVELDDLLGEGGYSKVYKGKIKSYQENSHNFEINVAVKKISSTFVNAKEKQKTGALKTEMTQNCVKLEISILRQLNHKNLVKYYGYKYNADEKEHNIVLEYVNGGSIQRVLSRRMKEHKKTFTELEIRDIVQQVLEGLRYLHSKKIIHRDLKPANLLYDRKEGLIKISDFGISAQLLELDENRKSFAGTPFYSAPETIMGLNYSFPADIWSLGSTVFELTTGHYPYKEVGRFKCFENISRGMTPPLPETCSQVFKDFISKCWTVDQKKRPTCSELLQHHFFAGYNEDCKLVL